MCESDVSEGEWGVEGAWGWVTMQKGHGSVKAQSKPTGGGCQARDALRVQLVPTDKSLLISASKGVAVWPITVRHRGHI